MAEPVFVLRKKRHGDDYEVRNERGRVWPVWEIVANGERVADVYPSRTRDWIWEAVYDYPFLSGSRTCSRKVNPPEFRPPDDFLRWVKLDILEALVLLDKLTEEDATATRHRIVGGMSGEPDPDEET